MSGKPWERFSEDKKPWEQYKETSVMEAVSPRLAREAQDPEGTGLSRFGAASLDALSLPGRFLATAYKGPVTGISAEELKRGMADIQGQSIPGQIVRDPALAATAPLAGPLLSGARALGMGGMAAVAGAGAAEGGIGAAVHQGERALAGKEISPAGAAFETGLGAVLPVAPSMANKALGRLASGLSGTSEEALRMYGTGFGKGPKDLKAAAGKANEVGQRLATAVDNAFDYMPEKAVIDETLKKMPPVNISKTLSILDEKARLLEKPLIGKPLPAEAQAAKELRNVINSIRGSTSAKFQKVIHPAESVRDLRKRLDLQLDDAMGADVKDAVDKALIAARSQLKNDLIDAAVASGNPQYVSTMESFANKLQKVDEIKGFLGGNKVDRKFRAESFTANLFGKNKTERQKLVGELGDIFGEDFLQQSKLVRLADELGPEGVPGLLPAQTTGRALMGGGMMGGGASLAVKTGDPKYLMLAAPGMLASPQVAAKTLGSVDIMGNVLRPVAPSVRAGVRSLGQRNY